MKNIDLETERLFLTRVAHKHISEEYLAWINDPEVHRYIETKGNYTMALLRSYVEKQYNDEIYFWALHLKESDKHIGNIKIDPIDPEKKSGEYGIMIGDKASWGQGFAKEASKRIIRYCFEELHLTKITLGVIRDNESALKLYQNMGFAIAETKTNSGMHNNKLCDSYRMALTVENFE